MVLGTELNTAKYIEANQICTTESPLNSSNPIDIKGLNIILDGVRLQRVRSTRFLDVIIDENYRTHYTVPQSYLTLIIVL